ncbi:hypothetical protein BELL_0420g00110 [Botrytis elliptica]|uniref:Uncharacterized protein n=1 Tax=Botrytis elliptica TaxID=278938 RepID=A0A4Z1JGQ2_9HELO|nr:hypothetical protein BELL_0420g00110 [Botrytis elliptica]
MSTSLTTGKTTKQFAESAQDDTKLLVLEQILKELREVSSHLRKQETRLSSVENGLRERSKLVDGKPIICGGNTIQVYSNDGRKSRTQIVDKTDESSSGNSTVVPLKYEIQGAISLPLDVMQIYHTDAISFERLGRKGVIEDEVPRLATSSEIDRWKSVVGDIYKVPEDRRLRLTFSTRWLLMLASSDDAQQHLDRIAHDEQLCRGHTTITDLFDSGQIIRYSIGVQDSNSGSHNNHCLDPTSTPCPVGTPSSKPLVGPWRRVISTSCPELRSTTLTQELVRREDNDIRSQTIPCAVRGITPMDRIIFHIKYFEIHNVKREEYICVPWTKLKSGRLHSDKEFSSGKFRILLESSYRLVALADRGCKQYRTLLEHKPLIFSQTISEVMHSDGDEVELVEASRKKLRQCFKRLEGIADGLNKKKEEAIDMRDGLFNVSAVMESRAATKSGENVKLLTFSVWSINDGIFSLRLLEIVTIVVGLSTYLIVFNLDSLMNLSRALHQRFVVFAISMMEMEASHTTWGKRAYNFEKFSLHREIEHKPSDWRLVQYLLYRALGMIGIIGRSTALLKHTKQRLSLATVASMKEARNPIWRDRAQRFEDAWTGGSTDKPSNWRSGYHWRPRNPTKSRSDIMLAKFH